jgi:uncharacterized protein
MGFATAAGCEEIMARIVWKPALFVLILLSAPASAQSGGGLAEARAAIEAKDYAKAITLLKPLADAGSIPAERELGAMYFKGLGTAPDAAKALKLFQDAARYGDAEAQKDVGVAYQNGPPGVANDVEAVRWLRLAAEKGNVDAESTLGFMYRTGRGTAQDFKEAIRWTVKAAEQGYPVALGNIGADFKDGAGVPQNNAQALFWIDIVLLRLQTDNPSRPNYQKYADDLALHLSANDVQRLAAEARNWSPGKGSLDNVLAMAGLPSNGPGTGPKAAAVAPPPPPRSGGGSTGSGFIIDTAGNVLTNNHVVDRCSGIQVRVANGAPVAATLIANDKTGDLAVLKPAGILGEPVFLRDKAARQGEHIMVAGFPLAGLLTSDMSVNEGIVSALSGFADNAHQIQISAPIQSGNSGGPVFDTEGAVIGVVQSAVNATQLGMAGAIAQNANFAIKVSSVREFLDAKAIPYQSGNGGKSSGTLPDRARRSTVFIECQR